MPYTVVMIPSAARTRVLLMDGPDELLRAVLPPPSQLHYERAAITFLESLALWLNQNVHVVLSVDEKEARCCLGLTDELGVGVRSVYFDVESVTGALGGDEVSAFAASVTSRTCASCGWCPTETSDAHAEVVASHQGCGT